MPKLSTDSRSPSIIKIESKEINIESNKGVGLFLALVKSYIYIIKKEIIIKVENKSNNEFKIIVIEIGA